MLIGHEPQCYLSYRDITGFGHQFTSARRLANDDLTHGRAAGDLLQYGLLRRHVVGHIHEIDAVKIVTVAIDKCELGVPIESILYLLRDGRPSASGQGSQARIGASFFDRQIPLLAPGEERRMPGAIGRIKTVDVHAGKLAQKALVDADKPVVVVSAKVLRMIVS
jgi:hypothetical protein